MCQRFGQSPSSVYKKPIVSSWHTPYKKPNGERARASNTVVK